MRQAEWEVVMLRKAFHSACRLIYGFAVCECNYRAELTALNVWHFAGSGVGQCPGTPHSLLWQASPETPHWRLYKELH